MKKDVIVGLVVVAAVAGAILLNPSAKKETKPSLTFSQRHAWAFKWRTADEIVPEPTNDPLRERNNVLDVGDDMDIFD